jgi:hypothetical protein
MRRTFPLILLTATLGLAGCQSHESKVSDLQKQYDQLGAHFQQSCPMDYSKVPPALSPECQKESNKLRDSWQQLSAERAKQK